MLLRPYGLVIAGHLELGLEILVDDDGTIVEIRPHTGIPDDYVLSPAFVNGHSHLEYRGLQGKLVSQSYWPWIRELTRLKADQALEDVASDAELAARENRATGVAYIAEHSDRPVARRAMQRAGLAGWIFQEVITFLEAADPSEKLAEIVRKAEEQDATPSPHAFHTVDSTTLRSLGSSPHPISIHVAESTAENELTLYGTGMVGEFYRSFGFAPPKTGLSVVATLKEFGLLRHRVQLVHVCDVDDRDIDLIASSGATVAHCPRSNLALDCVPAPIRELLDHQVPVSLGLDSAASSGPIDMFEEMRAALQVAEERGRPLHPNEVWDMATSEGARALRATGLDVADWSIEVGKRPPLLAIDVRGASSTEDLILAGSPEHVRWIEPSRSEVASSG